MPITVFVITNHWPLIYGSREFSRRGHDTIARATVGYNGEPVRYRKNMHKCNNECRDKLLAAPTDNKTVRLMGVPATLFFEGRSRSRGRERVGATL